jgi:hypothetical protein
MDGRGPKSQLDYAAPERQTPPRFGMHWGGWVLLAMLVSYFLATVARALFQLVSSA